MPFPSVDCHSWKDNKINSWDQWIMSSTSCIQGSKWRELITKKAYKHNLRLLMCSFFPRMTRRSCSKSCSKVLSVIQILNLLESILIFEHSIKIYSSQYQFQKCQLKIYSSHEPKVLVLEPRKVRKSTLETTNSIGCFETIQNFLFSLHL